MKRFKTLKAFAAVFALALASVAFMNVTEASAKETFTEAKGDYKDINWKYDSKLDSIVIEKKATDVSTAAFSLYFSGGKDIDDWSSTKNMFKLDLDEINNTKDTDDVSGQAIKLTSDSVKKIKVSKDSYFIIAATNGSITCDPDITVFASEWKAPTVILDYNAAYLGNTNIAIASVSYKANKGNTTVTEAVGQTDGLLSSDNGGNTNKKAFETLEWSMDGTTWYNVYDADNGFTGNRLANLVTSAGAVTVQVQFRQGGKDSTGTNTPNESAFRPSDAKKVTIKKAGTASRVKLDISKLPAINVKQKFDYQVVVTTKAIDASGKAITVTPGTIKPESDKWITVLAYNAKGTAKSPYMVNTEFKTVKMSKDAGEEISKFFTDDASVKKNLPLTSLLEWTSVQWAGTGDDAKDARDVRYGKKLDYIDLNPAKTYYVFVRKSATSTAPATAYSEISFEGMATEPKTDIKQKSGAYVSFDTKSATAYQYCIVSQSDYDFANPSANKIDWTSMPWKKLQTSTKINAGVKTSSYKTIVNGTATKGDKAGSLAVAGDYIFVRLAGDKSKNTLPSEYSVYSITENDKTNKKITIAAKSFIEAQKTLGIEVKAGSEVVASGNAIDCEVDLSAGKSATLEYTIEKAEPYKITKDNEREKASYKYYKGVVSGGSVVKGAETTDISVDAKKATVSAISNGIYVIEVSYDYNGDKLPTKTVVLRVSGVMTLKVTVDGSDAVSKSGIGYKVDLTEATEASIKASVAPNGTAKTSGVTYTYVSAKTAAVTVSTQGAINVVDSSAATSVNVTVTAAWTDKDKDKKDVNRTSSVVLEVIIKKIID